jgi:hypothetical protein
MQGPPDRLSTAAAVLILATATGVTIRANIFVPWGTDSGAYLIAAEGWATKELFTPASFLFWATWDHDGLVEAPFGHRPTSVKGAITGSYPLGYPVLLATALKLGGPLAPYVVAPLFVGLLAWCTFVLGGMMSSGWAGAAASLLIAASPVTVWQAMSPMSDVPAAALWALSLVMSLRPGRGAAIAAGLSTALAITVRPNLVPLAAVIAAVVLSADGRSRVGVHRVLLYGVFAAIGPGLVLWSQAVLYGHPFASGYEGADAFFSSDRIPYNVRFYPLQLVRLHSWLLLAGFLSVPLALRSRRAGPGQSRAALIACAALGIIAVNYALHLPYLTFEGWQWLRFMLPALTVLFVLFAALLDRIRLRLAERSRLLAVTMIIPLVYVAAHPRAVLKELFLAEGTFTRLQLMGHYLREALPTNAVILTYLHSGAAAFYTGRPVVRLDRLPADALDSVVADLRGHGLHPVFMVDHAVEGWSFHERFASSQYGRLDWPPRAEFYSASHITFHDPLDREGFYGGDVYPIDLLNWPTTSPYRGSWPRLHVPMESVSLPPLRESIMFMEALEVKYRDGLHRAATPRHLDPDSRVIWVLRYLRFRLHGCDHATSVNKVVQQIDGQGAQPLCRRVDAPVLPPWDETVHFRRQLEAKSATRPATPSFVDLEGDAVWTQEYLRYRMGQCSHRQATEAVMERIDGKGTRPLCAS